MAGILFDWVQNERISNRGEGEFAFIEKKVDDYKAVQILQTLTGFPTVEESKVMSSEDGKKTHMDHAIDLFSQVEDDQGMKIA